MVPSVLCAGCDYPVRSDWLKLYNGRWYCADCYNELMALKNGGGVF